MGVDSKKFEYGPGTIYAAFPSSLGLGGWNETVSSPSASTQEQYRCDPRPLSVTPSNSENHQRPQTEHPHIEARCSSSLPSP